MRKYEAWSRLFPKPLLFNILCLCLKPTQHHSQIKHSQVRHQAGHTEARPPAALGGEHGKRECTREVLRGDLEFLDMAGWGKATESRDRGRGREMAGLLSSTQKALFLSELLRTGWRRRSWHTHGDLFPHCQTLSLWLLPSWISVRAVMGR